MADNSYTAKIVNQSRPFLTSEGNSWISEAVYKAGESYYVRKVVTPEIQHGPWEIGEEIEIIPEKDDKIAEPWMAEVYENPKDYRLIINKKDRIREAAEERKSLLTEKKEERKSSLNTFLNLMISFLIVMILGYILLILIGS